MCTHCNQLMDVLYRKSDLKQRPTEKEARGETSFFFEHSDRNFDAVCSNDKLLIGKFEKLNIVVKSPQLLQGYYKVFIHLKCAIYGQLVCVKTNWP